MLRVKICGITSFDDAMTAIRYGADALGFVFYEQSPRYIKPEDAKKIIEKLPPFVEKVGLFVNMDASGINKIASDSKITLAQIHFDADNELLKELEVQYIKVIRAKSKEDLSIYLDDKYYLVDSYVESFGGEGKRLNLEWFDDIDCSKFILAGGLDSSNIDEVRKYNFYGVDVSSGVEKQKGIKDKSKIEEFLKRAKIW